MTTFIEADENDMPMDVGSDLDATIMTTQSMLSDDIFGRDPQAAATFLSGYVWMRAIQDAAATTCQHLEYAVEQLITCYAVQHPAVML